MALGVCDSGVAVVAGFGNAAAGGLCAAGVVAASMAAVSSGGDMGWFAPFGGLSAHHPSAVANAAMLKLNAQGHVIRVRRAPSVGAPMPSALGGPTTT